MGDFRKERLTLAQAAGIAGVPEFFYPHITFDPAAEPQYRIREQSTDDSTLIFTVGMIERALLPLINCQTYYLPMGLPAEGFVPQYTIGRIKLATVFGKVDLPCGRVNGIRQRIVIPVSVRYAPMESAKLPDYALIREYQDAMRKARLGDSQSAYRVRIESEAQQFGGNWLSSRTEPLRAFGAEG